MKPIAGIALSAGVSLLWVLAPASAGAQQPDPPQGDVHVVKPPPIPTGVIPLPQGPPPTGPRGPLPLPALPLMPGNRPMTVSPGSPELARILQGHSLTIDQAVAISLAASRSFATAVSGLYRAQGRTEEARAARNPTFGIGLSVVEYDASNVARFGNQSITIQNQFDAVIGPTLTLPIDIGGSLRAAVSQAQFQEVAARIEINRVRNQTVLDVKTAFYNALRAQAQLTVAQDAVSNALARLNVAQESYAAGTSPRFDVITAQRDVADAQQTLIQARSQVSLALALLKSSMGVSIRTPIRITDAGALEIPPDTALPAVLPTLPPGPRIGAGARAPTAPLIDPPGPRKAPRLGPEAGAPPQRTTTGETGTRTGVEVADPVTFGPDFDALNREAIRTRPEILEADANIAAARSGIQIARRSSRPTLAAVAGYDYNPTAAGFARVNAARVGLNLNVPILDGGLSRARVREAEGDIAAAEISRRQAADQVELEVEQAYLNLVQARERVAVANVGVQQAREAARLAGVRYRAGVSQQVGVSPILELSSAQTSLTQAQSSAVGALYDYNTARAQMDRAVGRYSYVPQSPGYPAPPTIRTNP